MMLSCHLSSVDNKFYQTTPKIRILLVCTDDLQLLLAKAYFYDFNDCDVHTTTDPRCADKLFYNYLVRNCSFDIVFLDYLLPPTNGITLGKKFRDLHPGIKLEFFASFFFNYKNIHDTFVEMFGYFKKPVYSFDQMEEAIETIRLEKKNQNRITA